MQTMRLTVPAACPDRAAGGQPRGIRRIEAAVVGGAEYTLPVPRHASGRHHFLELPLPDGRAEIFQSCKRCCRTCAMRSAF